MGLRMETRVSAPCSGCLRTTNHKVLYSVEKKENDIKGVFHLIECLGCEAVSLSMQTAWDGDELETQYYPSPVSRKRPEWLQELRSGWIGGQNYEQLGGLFDEVYEAVRGGQHRLAAMGIRAILENIMVAKVGDKGNFAANLEAFSESGYISLVQRDAMADILDAGHAAMHRTYKPSETDLKTALDITEGIFSAIYVHAEKARSVASRVPARKLKPSKK
jgi:hypothetical protein